MERTGTGHVLSLPSDQNQLNDLPLAVETEFAWILAGAILSLPRVLDPRVADRQPLQVNDGIRFAASERDDMIPDAAGHGRVVSPVEGHGCSR